MDFWQIKTINQKFSFNVARLRLTLDLQFGMPNYHSWKK